MFPHVINILISYRSL